MDTIQRIVEVMKNNFRFGQRKNVEPKLTPTIQSNWWDRLTPNQLIHHVEYHPEIREKYLSVIKDENSYIKWLTDWRLQYHKSVGIQKVYKKILRQPHPLVERKKWNQLNRCWEPYMGASEEIRNIQSSKSSTTEYLRKLVFIRLEAKQKLKSLQHTS